MHPILFHLGPVTVYTYGVFAALAVVCVYVFAIARARALGLPSAIAADLVFLLFISGVIGARLVFVWQHFEDFKDAPWQIFWVQRGGLVWYGGFIVAALAGVAYALRKKQPMLEWCDLFAPLLALGHGLGRVGCFFNGCCYGAVAGLSRYPVQLIEAGLLLVLSAYLFGQSPKKGQSGLIFTRYLLCYTVIRFFVEFLRGDQAPVGLLTLPQWTSLFLFIGALFLHRSIKKNNKVK